MFRDITSCNPFLVLLSWKLQLQIDNDEQMQLKHYFISDVLPFLLMINPKLFSMMYTFKDVCACICGCVHGRLYSLPKEYSYQHRYKSKIKGSYFLKKRNI